MAETFFDAVLQNPFIRGDVELDDAATAVFLSLLEPPMEKKVAAAVKEALGGGKGTPAHVSLTDLTITGNIALPEAAKESMYQDMVARQKKQGISGVDLTGCTLKSCTFDPSTITNISGALSNDAPLMGAVEAKATEAAKEVAKDALADVGKVNANPVHDTIAATVATIGTLGVTGGVALSPEAVKSLAAALMPAINQIATEAAKAACCCDCGKDKKGVAND